MKKEYSTAEIEVIEIRSQDVITTSDGGEFDNPFEP